ncbi:PepSY domain-containing protein [Qipengyuania sp. 902]|uniref:PepSY domain-containing protein n=1 Tax=Qipengyuania sp. 902 TaxID=3417565 RepID=UPI003EB75AF7
MGHQRTMRRFANWHIWLGWLVGVPILMWTVTGLVMVAKPIEEVRGNHLKLETTNEGFSGNPAPIPFKLDGSPQATEMRSYMQNGRLITTVTRPDGSIDRFDGASGQPLDDIDEQEARRIVRQGIVGGDKVASATKFDANDVPFDFRRPMPVWQVALEGGTHVYVGTETGRIEAVRTRWWRLFDVMWGLHIMDLETREDTHHPILILFAVLAVIGSLLGCILMFRRRKARVSTQAKVAA